MSANRDMTELYATLDLHQKASLFNLILWNDTVVFFEEEKLLEEAKPENCVVVINGVMLQLQVRPEKEVSGSSSNPKGSK